MELLLMILAGFIAWCFTGIKIIRQQKVGVVETLGKFSGTLSPGLNWIIPAPFSKVVHMADLKITEIKSDVEVKTSDNAFVNLPVSLMIRVSPSSVVDSYYKLDDPFSQINRWVLNSIRAIAAKMALVELFEDRQSIVTALTKDLQQKAKEFGFVIETVLIEQPSVSDEVQRASNRVVAAQREMEAAKAEAEAARIKQVAQAKAEAESQIERAKGLAASRKILAQSFQENIETISTTGANVADVMDLLMTINKLETMKDIGNNGNLVVMDSLNSSVATQAKLLKELDKEKNS